MRTGLNNAQKVNGTDAKQEDRNDPLITRTGTVRRFRLLFLSFDVILQVLGARLG